MPPLVPGGSHTQIFCQTTFFPSGLRPRPKNFTRPSKVLVSIKSFQNFCVPPPSSFRDIYFLCYYIALKGRSNPSGGSGRRSKSLDRAYPGAWIGPIQASKLQAQPGGYITTGIRWINIRRRAMTVEDVIGGLDRVWIGPIQAFN